MTKDKINKILGDYDLSPSDAENIFSAMSEILSCAADDLQKKEPYATLSIATLRDASIELLDFQSFCDE